MLKQLRSTRMRLAVAQNRPLVEQPGRAQYQSVEALARRISRSWICGKLPVLESSVTCEQSPVGCEDERRVLLYPSLPKLTQTAKLV
jgi:hypothetical protein